MDTGEILTESIAYTREAFEGKWVRWLIFVILALPMALVPFVFDAEKLLDKTTAAFHWELVPWEQLAVLFIAAFIFSFFTAGYMVRIYRGAKPAPDFDDWGNLFFDGLRLAVVMLLWLLPVLIVTLVVFAIAIGVGLSAGAGSAGLIIGLVLLALLIEIIVCLIVVLLSPIGEIRFARTGSITEGLRYSKITELIGRIGWGQYIIALVVLFVAIIVFTVITMVLSAIPYIGWVISLVITPLLTVFTARYYTLIYEQGGSRQVPP
jgi:hypothetical protein